MVVDLHAHYLPRSFLDAIEKEGGPYGAFLKKDGGDPTIIALHKALVEKRNALTPEQREAILLSRYQGLSYAEIAQISGCSEGAVKTRVFRAMETLKKALTAEERGGDRCLNAI